MDLNMDLPAFDRITAALAAHWSFLISATVSLAYSSTQCLLVRTISKKIQYTKISNYGDLPHETKIPIRK